MKIYSSDRLIRKDSSLHIFTHSGAAPMEQHTHDFIEILYVRAGSATQTVNDITYEIERGDVTFINYGSTHQFTPHGDFCYTNICFAPEVLGDAITPENAFALLQLTAFDELRRDADSGVLSFSGVGRQDIEALLDAMQREYEKKAQSWQTVLKSYMNILLVHLLRCLTVGQEDGVSTGNGIWQELSDYIDRNPGGELSLSALAGKCFYNPSYFSRAFKEKFGMPLTEYIHRRRIALVESLVADSHLNAEEIATRAGFSSKSALYRAFLREKGMSFSEFRRQK